MSKQPVEPSEAGQRVVSETDLIETYLVPLTDGAPGAFRLRDDAALISPEPATDLVFSTDPIIAGVHFFADESPADIAWKALAVNVSDLAAKGAAPLAYLLTLAFPEAPQRSWMTSFAAGLRAAQQEFGCRLLGGDTDHTPGPLSIGVTIIGALPKGSFVPRYGARRGDRVYVTGTIGDAALGLALRRNSDLFKGVLSDADRAGLVLRYLRPAPRRGLAAALRAHASAAMDVSDGLLKDLSRLASGFSLDFALSSVPISDAAKVTLESDARVADAILSGGDDYELIVAVTPAEEAAFRSAASVAGVPVTLLGSLEPGEGLVVRAADGRPIEPKRFGYDHFSA